MRAVAIAVLAVGCGFSPGNGDDGDDQSPVDAPQNGDGGGMDGDVDAMPPVGEWGVPTMITELDEALYTDDDPTLTADELEIYWASNRIGGQGGEDIWRARRASKSDPWTDIEVVIELSSPDLDSNVEISADGLTITMTSRRDTGATDLWWSTRIDRSAAWPAPVAIAELNSPYADFGAYLSPDLLSVVLCSSRNGTDEELYGSTRASAADQFPTPGLIPGLSSAGNDCDAMSPDGTTMYFTRSPGPAGGIDIHTATWTGATFDGIAHVVPLNTTFRDSDPWVSPDQRTMYFSSNRSGDDALYISRR
jgi:Tol biopolymer transport system component